MALAMRGSIIDWRDMMIVKCKSSDPNKTNCPYLPYCLARLADPMITGCGVPLYVAGVIPKSDIQVERIVHMDDSAPKQVAHRKGVHK